INTEKNFRVRYPAGFVPVGLLRKRSLLTLDPEFWCTGKLTFLSDDRFHDRLCVAHGNSDAGGHDEGQIEKGTLPGFGAKLPLGDQIKAGDGTSGSQEQRQIDEQHLEPALLEPHNHDRQQHSGKQNHQGITDVRGQVKKSLCFDVPWRIRFPNFGKNLFCGLHKALGPAGLLGFEAVHVHGQLRSALDLRQVKKLPPFELRAIGKIGVFGEGVVLPAARVVNGFAAPHAGRAIEVKEGAATGAGAVLNDEVAVEKNGFHVGQEGIIGVEIGPASLHHADFRAAIGIHEIRNGAAEKIGLREKVGVKHGDEFALGGFQAVFEGAGFVTLAIGAMNVNNGHALGGVALDAGASDFASLIRGVVKDLHIEQLEWIVETRNGFDETFNDVALVEDRQLDRDARPICDRRRSGRDILRIHEVVIDQPIAMEAVNGKDKKNDEVGNHHREVETIGVIDASECRVRNFVP